MKASDTQLRFDDPALEVLRLRDVIDCAGNALRDSIHCSGNDPETNMHWVRRMTASAKPLNAEEMKRLDEAAAAAPSQADRGEK